MDDEDDIITIPEIDTSPDIADSTLPVQVPILMVAPQVSPMNSPSQDLSKDIRGNLKRSRKLTRQDYESRDFTIRKGTNPNSETTNRNRVSYFKTQVSAINHPYHSINTFCLLCKCSNEEQEQ